MTPRPVPLLARHSKTAPRFDPSKPLSLWDYFWDYEILSEAAQLDEATKIKKSIIYLTRDDADFWESLDEYIAANDWQAFKKAVLSFYPGSIPKERWASCDLDELCKAQKTKQVKTRGDFAEFTRPFMVISVALISQGLLSDLEARKLYWNALDQDFKGKLIRKVELTKPAYTLRTILTIEEIRHAAGLVLDGTVADTSTEVSKSTEKATLVTSLEPAKLEPFDTERFAQIIAAMIVQTVQTAITMALDQVNSMYVPSLQTNTHRNYPGASCPTSVKEESPANFRDGPKAQEIDDLGDRFSGSTTVASSNTNDTQTSSNLVKAESSEIDVEQQEGLDTYIAALQKFNLHGGENDEGLEDVIRVLKARINKKKRTNGTSYQGPQEKRTGVLLKSTPFSPILEAAEQDGLPTLREALVEPLLTLSPESRRQFKEAATGRRVENVKEEVETASTVAAYLVGGAYSSKFGVFSRSQQAHATLSEPIEALSSVLLVEVSLEKGDAAVEARKQKKGELADEKGEVSHRPSVVELFEEKECFPLSPHVIDPPRNEKSFMYLPSPHVQSLKVSPSMYSIAPPVPVCYSAVTNSSRIVCAGPSIVNASEWGSERKKSRPRAVKKIERLLYDPGGEGLVQFRTSMLAKVTCTYLGTPFDEEPVYAQNRDLTPLRDTESSHDPFIKCSTVLVAASSRNKPPDSRTAILVRDKKRNYNGKLVPASFLDCQNPQKIFLFSFDHRDDSGGSEMKKSQRLLKDMALVPYDFKHGELASFEAFWMYVLAQAYLTKLVKAASLVCSQNQDTALLPQSEIVFVIETSTAVAVMSQIIERARPNASTPVKRETRVKCTRDVPAFTSEKTCIAYWYPSIQLLYRSKLDPSYPLVQRLVVLRREEKLLRQRKRRIRTMFEDPAEVTYLVPIVESTLTTAKLMAGKSPAAPRTTRRSRRVFSEDLRRGEKDGNESLEEDLEGRPRRRRRRLLRAKTTFAEGLRPGRSSCRRSCKKRLWERDIEWEESSLVQNRSVEREQKCETQRRYPEPRFDGWRKGRSLQASGWRQCHQQDPYQGAQLHTMAEETRVAPLHSSSYSVPTPKRKRWLQKRLTGPQGSIPMRPDVELKEPGSDGDLQVKIESGVSRRSLVIVDLQLLSGRPKAEFGFLIDTDGAVGKLACRVPMPALSCTIIGYLESVAKIVGAEEDSAGTQAEERLQSYDLQCHILPSLFYSAHRSSSIT